MTSLLLWIACCFFFLAVEDLPEEVHEAAEQGIFCYCDLSVLVKDADEEGEKEKNKHLIIHFYLFILTDEIIEDLEIDKKMSGMSSYK